MIIFLLFFFNTAISSNNELSQPFFSVFFMGSTRIDDPTFITIVFALKICEQFFLSKINLLDPICFLSFLFLLFLFCFQQSFL